MYIVWGPEACLSTFFFCRLRGNARPLRRKIVFAVASFATESLNVNRPVIISVARGGGGGAIMLFRSFVGTFGNFQYRQRLSI